MIAQNGESTVRCPVNGDELLANTVLHVLPNLAMLLAMVESYMATLTLL